MRLEFDRTTIVFIIFVVIIGALFGINYLVQQQPAQTFTIAIDPLAEDWARAATTAYNASNPVVNGTTRIRVEVVLVDDVDVWRGSAGWTTTNHPIGWLAPSTASVNAVGNAHPLRTVSASTARTPLVWGGFAERVALITANGDSFDWGAVQTVATAQRWPSDSANVNMAILSLSNSIGGAGALLSAGASYAQSPLVDTATLSSAEFSTWFNPIRDSLFNSQRIGGSVAQSLATRGTTVADFAILPEVQWLQAVSSLPRDFVFTYPEYQFILDFPLVGWNDTLTTDIQRASVESFGAFLLSAEGQSLAVEHGLRPALSDPTSGTLFTSAEGRGIALTLPLAQVIEMPSRDVLNRLISLLN